MFRRVSLLVMGLVFCNASADDKIIIGQTNVDDVECFRAESEATVYSEVPLNGKYLQHFCTTEGEVPSFVCAIVDESKVIEGMRLEYRAGLFDDFAADLESRFGEGSRISQSPQNSEIEYTNGNLLIRLKDSGSKTVVIYGTKNLFRTLCGRRSNENKCLSEKIPSCIRPGRSCKMNQEKRRELFGPRREIKAEQPSSVADKDVKDPGMEIEISSPNSVFQMDDFDDMKFPSFFGSSFGGFFDDFKAHFKDTEELFKQVERRAIKDDNVKTYRTEKRYSKDGDVEKWYNDDNGQITEVEKTPKGTTITKTDRNGRTRTIRRGNFDLNPETDEL